MPIVYAEYDSVPGGRDGMRVTSVVMYLTLLISCLPVSFVHAAPFGV